MLEKHRSLRGSIISKIKKSVFVVFGENELPPINLDASPAEINQWKSLQNVQRCYENLFQPIPEARDVNLTYIVLILARVWPVTPPSQTQTAYGISVCQTLLNPNEKNIKITKRVIKEKLQNNLVSFAAFCK